MASTHELLAIAPPSVSITAKKNTDAETLKEQQATESISFQKEIYSWLLRRKMKGQFSCDFQSTDDTNALLQQAGYPEKRMTSEQMCEILGVDGLIKTNFALSKPISEGTAVVLTLLVGA